MQEFMYDFFDGIFDEIALMDAYGVEEEIKYWLSGKEAAADCFGFKNE